MNNICNFLSLYPSLWGSFAINFKIIMLIYENIRNFFNLLKYTNCTYTINEIFDLTTALVCNTLMCCERAMRVSCHVTSCEFSFGVVAFACVLCTRPQQLRQRSSVQCVCVQCALLHRTDRGEPCRVRLMPRICHSPLYLVSAAACAKSIGQRAVQCRVPCGRQSTSTL